MNAYEFEHYIKPAIKEYASELTISGSSSESDSMKNAQKTFDYLLPDGIKSEGQYLFHVINKTDAIIGMTWFGLRSNNEGFIYDFSINETFRGQGFGTKTMELLEKEAKKHGVKKLGLHVFGHNFAAISLYKKMGYTVYSMNMSKEI